MVTCEILEGDWIRLDDGWFQVRKIERDYSLSDSEIPYTELLYFRKNQYRYDVTCRKYVKGVLSDDAMMQNIEQTLISANESSCVGIFKQICRGLVNVCDYESNTFGYDNAYEMAKKIIKGESS